MARQAEWRAEWRAAWSYGSPAVFRPRKPALELGDKLGGVHCVHTSLSTSSDIRSTDRWRRIYCYLSPWTSSRSL